MGKRQNKTLTERFYDGKPLCDHGYVVSDQKWCPYPDCPNGFPGDIRKNGRGKWVKRIRCESRRTGNVWFMWRETNRSPFELVAKP